jgi:hypothetical protein
VNAPLVRKSKGSAKNFKEDFQFVTNFISNFNKFLTNDQNQSRLAVGDRFTVSGTSAKKLTFLKNIKVKRHGSFFCKKSTPKRQTSTQKFLTSTKRQIPILQYFI